MIVCDICGIFEPEHECSCDSCRGDPFVVCDDCFINEKSIVKTHKWSGDK